MSDIDTELKTHLSAIKVEFEDYSDRDLFMLLLIDSRIKKYQIQEIRKLLLFAIAWMILYYCSLVFILYRWFNG